MQSTSTKFGDDSSSHFPCKADSQTHRHIDRHRCRDTDTDTHTVTIPLITLPMHWLPPEWVTYNQQQAAH